MEAFLCRQFRPGNVYRLRRKKGRHGPTYIKISLSQTVLPEVPTQQNLSCQLQRYDVHVGDAPPYPWSDASKYLCTLVRYSRLGISQTE